MQTQVNEDKNLGVATQDRKTDQSVLRELDAKVADRIMGLTPCHKWEPVNFGRAGGAAMINYGCEHEGKCVSAKSGPPHYSTSIEAAMEVVEKIGFDANDSMRAINISVFSIHRYPDGQWPVHFSLKGKAYAETLPLAICRAALDATNNR